MAGHVCEGQGLCPIQVAIPSRTVWEALGGKRIYIKFVKLHIHISDQCH